MAIHENLTRVPKQQLRQIGWTKARELAKVARREGERFESAPWVHKAQALPKEEFKREVERHLTGHDTEAWELLYFKLYKSQLVVIEQALETAGLMLGSDKSRGYCLEMICADFLAGANLQDGNPEALLLAMQRLLAMLLPEHKGGSPFVDFGREQHGRVNPQARPTTQGRSLPFASIGFWSPRQRARRAQLTQRFCGNGCR